MKTFLPYLTSILFLFSSISLKAGTITATAAGGSWQSTGTWVGGVVPGASDVVIIPSGSSVTYLATGVTPDAVDNDPFVNPASIKVSGSFVLSDVNGFDPIFTTPLNIYVLNGGTFSDNTPGAEYWLQETSHIYVYAGGTYLMPNDGSVVIDGFYENSGPPPSGEVQINGASKAGPFYVTVSPGNTFLTNGTPPPPPPTVATVAATAVDTAHATLNGIVNDNGGATTASIIWSSTDPTLATGNTLTPVPSTIGAGSGNTSVSGTLSGLTYSTKYYYEVTATNTGGTTTGNILNFTTAPVVYNVSVPPDGTYTAGSVLTFTIGWTFITEAPLSVNTAGGTPYINVTVGNKTERAVLASADPNLAQLYFNYTVTPGDYAAGGITLNFPIILNGGTIHDPFGDPVGVITPLTALPPTTGLVINAPAVPIATTGTNDLVTGTSATIYGAVDDSGATTAVTFLYGTSPTLAGASTISGIASSVPAGSGNTPDSAKLTGLAPGTTYYYAVQGANSQGTITGSILSFTTAPDQPPVVTTTGGTTTFDASGASSTAVTVDGGITVTDPDNTTLASATITIGSGFSAGDVLAFTPSGGISSSYNAASGVLTLTGAAATLAQWQTALQSVTFVNTSSSPTLGNRVISFVANDGSLSSIAATKTVNVVAGLSFTGGSTQTQSVCENSAAQSINNLFTTTDPATGESLTYAVVSGPTNGTLSGFPGSATSNGGSVTPTGLTYTPTTGYSGVDAFTISVTNGSVTSQTTINVTVNPQPTVQPITGPASVCASASITLADATSGGVWTSGSTGVATIDPSSGQLTGVAQGTSTITYTVTNTFTCANSSTAPIAVNPVPATPSAITGPASVSNEQTGVGYSVTNDPTVTYAWSYSGTGVTINGATSSVTLDFSSTATSGTLSVTPVSSCGVSGTAQTLAISVGAPTITLAPATLPMATVGAAYSQPVSASGGTTPYTFAITSGSLPAGMSLASDGTLSGTPTAGGSFSLSITATDAGGFNGSQAYTLTVNAATITLAPATLPAATVGAAYSQSVSASGGTAPYTYSETGALPTGLTLASDGTLSGTPTAGGSFSFTITATDASTGTGPFTGSQAYTLVVNAPTITVAPTTLPAATVGVAYSQSVSASGGTAPYTYSETGALPTGLTLASDGTLSGTPTAGGSFSFTITATDASTGTGPYTGSQAYTLTVNAATVTVGPATLPAATVGAAYNQSVSASGGTAPYTYSETGALPAGLTLASDGTLSGTPTAGGSFSFTITATDASTGTGPFTGSQAYTLVVNAPTITVAPTTLPAATVGVAYSQSVSGGGGTSPYTYTATGTLPTGLTLAGDGTLSGTPTAGGSFSFTITATDASTGTGPYTGSQAYTLTVNAATVTIGPATLPAATVGAAYNQSVSASGGTAPYTYSETGALPAGLTLASDGTLSGTPTEGGSFSFTITATDASTGTGPYTGSQAYTLTVNAPTITLSPASLPAATVGIAYTQSVTASGGTGPYTYGEAGTLPTGVNFASDGTLSGTPTQGGSFSITITATDASTGAAAPYTGAQSYTFVVNPPGVSVAPATLPAATVGVVYAQTIVASGGTAPYTYTETGALPAGMALSAGGILSGTPTEGGSFNITVMATDASTGTQYSASQSYTLTVNAPTITIAPTTLPAAAIGIAYSQPVSANGGTAPYTFTLTSGSLPSGMSLATDGILSGTPTTGGSFNITITATDASTGTGAPYTGSQSYTFIVNAPTITLAPASLPAATVGIAYSQSVNAGGGTAPYTYAESGALPGGVTFAADGTLSGTPTAGGSFNITITATDASTGTGAPYTGSQSYTFIVNAPTISLAPTSLPPATIGAAYSQGVSASGGTSPYTFTESGALPAGLTLATNGTLSGTPTAGGSFTFTITATDASTGTPFTGSQSYTLTVNAPSGISLSPSTLPGGAYDVAYAGATISASGGTAPYTFAATGTLPPGLTLSSAGVLSGTPSAVGDYSFTVTATDASTGAGPYSNSLSYSIHIAPATLTITAVDQSMTYGGAVPALTVTYSGFIGGDNISSLTTPPSVTTLATPASGVGPYKITASGAVDPNYNIVYVNGTLTVNPADLLITAAPVTRFFNTPNPTLTYTYSGFVNGDNASVLTSLPSISTTAVQTSAPGQYPITLSGGAAANYTLLYQDAVLTVLASQANLITFNPLLVKTYGDPDFVITATANSGLPVRFVSSDPTIATVTQDALGNWVVHIVAAGEVTISAFQDGNGTYAPAAEVDQNLQINKANQTITFPALPTSVTTVGIPVTLAATASSGLPVTYTLSDPTIAVIVGNQLTFTGAGAETVTATQAGNNDYNAAAPVSYTVSIFNAAGYVSHIGVFPNPAHGTLHIRFSSDYLITKYIIFAMDGRVVRGEEDVTNNNNDLQVNIADLTPGYYLVRVVCIRNHDLVFPVFKIFVY